MISSAIEVQLVGQSPLILILPAVAIVLSLLSIGLTFWLRQRDDARIVVTTNFSYILFPDEIIHYVIFTATNKGRAGSTVLNSLELRDRTGQGLFYPDGTSFDSTLPLALAPGASARVALPVDSVREAVAAGKFDLSKATVVATSGHGTKAVGLGKRAGTKLSQPAVRS